MRRLLPLLATLALAAAQAPVPAPVAAPAQKPAAQCVFCKIVAGTAPSKKVYENDHVLAFWDIRPRAKVHLLVIPKQHVASLKELDDLPVATRAALLSACVKVARDQGILDEGFRVISNAGKDASQSVFHLHFHVVGGEKLREDAITKDPAIR
ncbi:MAG: histidine triad nucleotide-binding protein [Holophagaceae bacterium]|nr:histidine triad nucleotide-binding protein [Holophagaceae bacterium]